MQARATVTCSEDAGSIREINLAPEDADGAAVTDEGPLWLLAAARAVPRKGAGGGHTEACHTKSGWKEGLKKPIDLKSAFIVSLTLPSKHLFG